MFKAVGKLTPSPLVRGSIIVFVGSVTTGLGNYFFNIVMGRMLGPADFAMMASLFSLMYIISVPAATLDLITARYVARYKAKNAFGLIASFITKFNRKSFLLGLIAFGVFVFFSPFIADYLHLPSSWLVVVLGTAFLVSFIVPVNRGGLKGLQNFSQFSINLVLNVALKIAIAVFLVYIGWGVTGALLALTFSVAIVSFHAYYSLNLSRERPPLRLDMKKIMAYAKPVFIVSLCVAVLYNIDVVLAKHFLDPTEAGFYAVLSLLGKIIFFGTGSIAIVMFPLVAKKQAQGEQYQHIFRKSILLITILSVILGAVYFMFPRFIVTALFGAEYLPVAGYLGWFGLVIVAFSLVNIIVHYWLSLRKTSFYYLLVIGSVLQVSLLYVFHANIWQFVWSMLAVMVTLLALLLIYSWLNSRRKHLTT